MSVINGIEQINYIINGLCGVLFKLCFTQCNYSVLEDVIDSLSKVSLSQLVNIIYQWLYVEEMAHSGKLSLTLQHCCLLSPGLNFQSIPVVCIQVPLQVSQTGGFPYQRDRYSPRLVLIIGDLRRSGLLHQTPPYLLSHGFFILPFHFFKLSLSGLQFLLPKKNIFKV